MILTVNCPTCDSRYSVTPEMSGKSIVCKKCKQPIVITSSSNSKNLPATPDLGSRSQSDFAVLEKKTRGRLGRFELIAKVGAGAFGTVFRAFDPVLERVVALKTPHPGALQSEREKARFLREPKVAAQLRHPNIVPIYDAGIDGDRLFIASAFIEGETLKSRMERSKPDLRESAHLIVALASALYYAHAQGVVHRDIKPANIMVDHNNQPLIMDFGLAKLRESEDQVTHEGAVLGTPAYMPPEQAAGKQHEIGAHSDQYSLGSVLYQLLTGELPFSGPAALVISLVQNQEPPTPRSVNPDVPRDLETICQKAMSKKAADRYQSCGDLADDIRRWLDNEPIKARPMSAPERFGRWIKREPVVASLIAGVIGIFAVGMSVSAWQWRRAELATIEQTEVSNALQIKNEQLAQSQALIQKEVDLKSSALRRSSRQAYGARMQQIQNAWENGQFSLVRGLLEETTPGPGEPDWRGWEWHFLKQALAPTSKQRADVTPNVKGTVGTRHFSLQKNSNRFVLTPSWKVYHNGSNTFTELLTARHFSDDAISEPSLLIDKPVHIAKFSPSGLFLAGSTNSRSVSVWNVNTKQIVFAFDKFAHTVSDISWAPDSHKLFVGGFDEGSDRQSLGEWKIFECESGKTIRESKSKNSQPMCSAWNSKSTRLVIGHYRSYREDHSGLEMVSLDSNSEPVEIKNAESAYYHVLWSPDDRLLFARKTGVAPYRVQIIDLNAQSFLRSAEMESIQFSYNNESNAILGFYGTALRVWDTMSQRLRTVFHVSDRNSLVYSNLASWTGKGSRFVTIHTDMTRNAPSTWLQLWDADELRSFHERIDVHSSQIASNKVLWYPDSRRLVSFGSDGSVYFVDSDGNQKSALKLKLESQVHRVRWNGSPNGDNRVLIVGLDGSLKCWNTDQNQLLDVQANSKHRISSADWIAGTNEALAGTDNGLVIRVECHAKAKPRDLVTMKGAIHDIFVTDQGRKAVIISSDRRISYWDLVQSKEIDSTTVPFEITLSDIQANRQKLAVSDSEKCIHLFDIVNGCKPIGMLVGHRSKIVSLAWNPEGSRLASIDETGYVRFWDPETLGQVFGIQEGAFASTRVDLNQASDVSWSPDGKKLSIAGFERSHRESHGVVDVYIVGNDRGLTARPGSGSSIDASKVDAGQAAKNSNSLINQANLNASAKSVQDIQLLPSAKNLLQGVKPSWSGDGKHLVFSVYPFGKGIRGYEFATDKVEPILDSGKDGAINPIDMNRLAFVRGEGQNEEIWLLERQSKSTRKLCDGSFPSWMPDGKRILFHSPREAKVKVIDSVDSSAVAEELAAVNGCNWYPSFSFDGRFAATMKSGQILKIDLSDKSTVQLPCPGNSIPRGFLSALSPDGRYISFGSYGVGEQYGFWIIDTKHGKTRKLVDGDIAYSTWSPDGKKIAVDIRHVGKNPEIWVFDAP